MSTSAPTAGATATVVFQPDGKRTSVETGLSLLEAAKKAGVGIRSECGGLGICGKCRIVALTKSGLSPLMEIEKEHLTEHDIKAGYRLACCSRVMSDVTISIPEESRLETRKILVKGLEKHVSLDPAVHKIHVTVPQPVISDVRADLERVLDHLGGLSAQLEIDLNLLQQLPKTLREAGWDITLTIWNGQRIIAVESGNTTNRVHGIAVDIGTSKIIGYLIDLTTGKLVNAESLENPQIIHGEDIISRISSTMRNQEKLEELRKLAVEGVNRVIHETCEKASIKPRDVYEMTVVGNTAMHHIFLGIQPKYLALSPYVPVIKRSINLRAKELGVDINPTGNIHVLPVIAGFVGADAVADVLATGIYEAEELCLLLDIGTNTEVFIGNRDDILTCSCASGPAFEGVHIKHGIKAVSGAIERIRIDPRSYEVTYKTVNGKKPIGLCGSAVVDALAEMLKAQIIDWRGKFNEKIDTSRVRQVKDLTEFLIASKDETGTGEDITITQKDIREVQLAKAAIYTGCAILMKRKKIVEDAVEKVVLAGAFGNYLDPVSSKIIGLIPDVSTKKIKFVGNAAGSGARITLLSRGMRETAQAISKRVRYLELATDPDFRTEFASAMYLPHRNLNRFPSAKPVSRNDKSLRHKDR